MEEQKPTPSKESPLGWIEARVNLTEIVSFLSMFGLLPAELDSRKPLRAALAESMSRPLPSYARWPHVLGILSFLLFTFLIVTGVLLSFYYQPTAADAYRSATSIARDVTLGGLVHQAHRWASILLLCVLVLRLLRFFFGGLYSRGRELVWMVAVLTLGVATIADLSGRLLPWDARGYWTMVRAREVFDELPIIGPLSTFLVGGTGLDSLILTRFYVLHILTLPFLMLLLFYIHFSSVRRVGLSRVGGVPLVAPPAAGRRVRRHPGRPVPGRRARHADRAVAEPVRRRSRPAAHAAERPPAPVPAGAARPAGDAAVDRADVRQGPVPRGTRSRSCSCCRSSTGAGAPARAAGSCSRWASWPACCGS